MNSYIVTGWAAHVVKILLLELSCKSSYFSFSVVRA